MNLPSVMDYHRDGRNAAIASSDDLADMLADRAHVLGLGEEWMAGVLIAALRALGRLQREDLETTITRGEE